MLERISNISVSLISNGQILGKKITETTIKCENRIQFVHVLLDKIKNPELIGFILWNML